MCMRFYCHFGKYSKRAVIIAHARNFKPIMARATFVGRTKPVLRSVALSAETQKDMVDVNF